MDDYPNLRLVKAKYNFKGKNNDELCFKKGDYIVLTQPIDSDWWEGTLNGLTGWFPVSYVQEVRYDQLPDEVKQKHFGNKAKSSNLANSGPPTRSYHTEVLASVIETEGQFVSELDQSWSGMIQPISGANLLSKEEFAIVSSNYEEILNLHRQFLTALKETSKQALNVRRVGRVYLEHAPAFRVVYERYASNHPRAVRILHAQKQKSNTQNSLGRFISERSGQSQSATTPQDVQALLPLTTALALPLNRLEKLPLTLRELERHLDEGHFDRGDTQRALALFKSLIADCQELRLLRELELDLANASVPNLPPSLEAPGPENAHKLAHGVVFLSPVKLATGTDIVDRLFVLYPTKLVILSAEPDLTKLAFEAEFPLSHLFVDRTLPNPELSKRFLHSFALYFKPLVPLASPEESASERPSSDCFVIVCSSSSLAARWIDLLSSVCSSESSLSVKSSEPENVKPSQKIINPEILHSLPVSQNAANRRSASLNQFPGLKPVGICGGFTLNPISCVVSNTPLSQISSNVAALAPASPHPNRKPGNTVSTAALTAAQVATASTPLARKKFALGGAGLSFLGPQLIPASAQEANEDQQLMQIVESFVSTPQMVSIERAQSNLSPSNSDHKLNGHGHTFSGTQLQTIHHGLTIEPILHSQISGGHISLSHQIRSSSSHTQSRNSASIRHDLLIAEEEKLLLEELKPMNETSSSAGGALQERTLVDAVYTLWDYVSELRAEVAKLRAAQGQPVH